jgi:hypothetical protein
MNVAGVTPVEALMWLGMWIGVLALIAGFVVWRGRRRGSRTIALDTALTLAGWWLAFSTIGYAIQITNTLTLSWIEFPDASVYGGWPGPTLCGSIEERQVTEPTLICAKLHSANVTIEGLGMGIRLLVAGGLLLAWILTSIPAAMLAAIAWNALRGVPFAASVPRTLYIGAGAIVVAALGAAVLTGLGEHAALSTVLPDADVTPAVVQFTIDPLVFGGAIALGALGAVFQHGSVLQKDTEGLV